jgi:CubicO group peptidase (beta-lactamase class C family)
MIMMKKYILSLIAFCLSFTACEKMPVEEEKFPAGAFVKSGEYLGDYWPADEWRTCHPEQVGMDANKLKDLNDEIVLMLRLHVDFHSLLITRKGYIVAEQYYSDQYGQDSLHRIHSCSKSITSAALGIAIGEGYIADEEQAVMDFFPGYIVENPDPMKDEITIRHLLTMSAGLEWYEFEYPYTDERNTYNHWVQSEDLVKFVLDRPMAYTPGTVYEYSTGFTHLLSAIIWRATGMRTDSFVNEKIFKPLNITDYSWPVDRNGIPYGGAGIWLKPRDMAKFGYLYLKEGLWEQNQIVPDAWVEESSLPHIANRFIQGYHYGYHWWVSENRYFAAVGYGGQWLYVIPDYEMVVVFNGMLDDADSWQISAPERLLQTYILPAVNEQD